MDDRELVHVLREQLSSMSSAFALSMVMFDRTDEAEILGLALSSATAIGPFRPVGTYVTRDWRGEGTIADPELRARLTELAGADGRTGALPSDLPRSRHVA